MLEHLSGNLEPVGRLVVIGGGGFIGNHILQVAAAKGIETRSVIRADVELTAVDADRTLASLLRPDDCVCAVAAMAPVKNLEMMAANVAIMRTIFCALDAQPVAYLLNIGSDAVYADASTPLTEESPRGPESLHGLMHLTREVAFGDLDVRQGTLRPTLVHGADDPHNGYGPNRFRRQAEAGETILLFGEGEEQRDHVDVRDVADLAVRMVCYRSQGVLNAATGKVWSFREIAEMTVAAYGNRCTIQGSPRQGAMPHNGWRPFDSAATFAAFPDFRYRSLSDAIREISEKD